MAVAKQKTSKTRVSPSATKKLVSKKEVPVKAAKPAKATAKKAPPARQAAAALKKAPVSKPRPPVQPAVSVSVLSKVQVTRQKDLIPVALKPTAQTCPLVLDGIVLAEDFSPRECFSCDEFDCRFYSAEESSGLLGSRLFAGGDAEDEADEEADLFGSERGEDDASLWGDEEDE